MKKTKVNYFSSIAFLSVVLFSTYYAGAVFAQNGEKSARQYCADGVSYFQRSKMRDAERAFLMALRVTPEDKDAWIGLMDVYRAQQRNVEGIAAADNALAHHEDDPEFWIRKGIFLREAERLQEASAALQRAAQVSSSDQAVVKRVKNELYYDRDSKGRVNLGTGQ